MNKEEFEARQAYFKEFGEILVRRHGQNYYSSYHNRNRVTVDEAAVRFGRYLRAARANAGLSITELAGQTKITEARLISLEQGLILACDINPRWLKQLAEILAEDVEDFNILLGRKNSDGYNKSRWFVQRWAIQCQNLLTFYGKVPLLSKPIYGAVSVILLCFAISIFLFLRVDFSEQLPPKQDVNPSIVAESEHRSNLFRADPGLENQTLIKTSQSRSLPIQTYTSSGIVRRY